MARGVRVQHRQDGLIMTFLKELTALINKYSLENKSNTPDFILANYLTHCLELFNSATLQREAWHGKGLEIKAKGDENDIPMPH